MGREDISGPFNLHQSMGSGHTAEPAWPGEDGSLWDGERFNNRYLKLVVRQVGRVEDPVLEVTVVGEEDPAPVTAVEAYLQRLFTLTMDLKEFYERFRGDPLAEAFTPFKGLRLMRAADPFESLICSISSQYSSIQKWNASIRRLKKRLCKPVRMGDGSIFHPFPSPETLAGAGEKDLKSCGLGYRASYILSAARRVAEGRLNLKALADKGYGEAKKMLVTLPGVGSKVADCFLLYGLGFGEAAPVDVWINRIVSHLYLNDRKASDREVESQLHHRFGGWAGLAHLYLYCYARHKLRSRLRGPSLDSLA